MTFSGELLVLDESLTGAVVLVVDASGKDWVSGDATVAGRPVTAALEPGMPTAGYQVRWQVVSEDGHPIAGVIPFTIGDAEPLQSPTSGGSTATPPASAEQPDQTAADSAAPSGCCSSARAERPWPSSPSSSFDSFVVLRRQPLRRTTADPRQMTCERHHCEHHQEPPPPSPL